MNKQQFVPQTDENRYLNTTHKCNLTGAELSTILYCLEGYVAGLDDVEYDEIANTDEQWDLIDYALCEYQDHEDATEKCKETLDVIYQLFRTSY